MVGMEGPGQWSPSPPRSRPLELLQDELEAQQCGEGKALGGTENSAVVSVTGPDSCLNPPGTYYYCDSGQVT